jgi:hypothetical protein
MKKLILIIAVMCAFLITFSCASTTKKKYNPVEKKVEQVKQDPGDAALDLWWWIDILSDL